MMRLMAVGAAVLACGCASAAGTFDYDREYKEASALAAAGKEEGISRLFELRRRAQSAELSEALVVDLYYYLHEVPEVWIRALSRQDPKRMTAFLKRAGLGYEVPDACASRAACSTAIIDRLTKFRGTKDQEALAREVIETLKRTMKG